MMLFRLITILPCGRFAFCPSFLCCLIFVVFSEKFNAFVGSLWYNFPRKNRECNIIFPLKDESMRDKKYAVFTMDVEAFSDTECIRRKGIRVDDDCIDGFDEFIRIMDQYGIRTTLFTLGSIAPKIADRLKACIANGHSLALHGSIHVPPMTITPEQFREDVLLAKKQMQEIFNIDVTGYRAPSFSIDRTRLDILRDIGFRYDSSYLNFSPADHTVRLDLSDYRKLRKEIFRRDDFYEFGLSKGRILGIPLPISGGGYFRLSPWWFVKILLRRFIRKSDYYVFYLHPFELTGKKIPRIKGLNLCQKFYIRYGIRSCRKRIEFIIDLLSRQGYEFVTFEQLVQIMEADHSESAEA